MNWRVIGKLPGGLVLASLTLSRGARPVIIVGSKAREFAMAAGLGFESGLPPAARWYGAGGEGDGTIVAGK